MSAESLFLAHVFPKPLPHSFQTTSHDFQCNESAEQQNEECNADTDGCVADCRLLDAEIICGSGAGRCSGGASGR